MVQWQGGLHCCRHSALHAAAPVREENWRVRHHVQLLVMTDNPVEPFYMEGKAIPDINREIDGAGNHIAGSRPHSQGAHRADQAAISLKRRMPSPSWATIAGGLNLVDGLGCARQGVSPQWHRDGPCMALRPQNPETGPVNTQLHPPGDLSRPTLIWSLHGSLHISQPGKKVCRVAVAAPDSGSRLSGMGMAPAWPCAHKPWRSVMQICASSPLEI